jgi:hypothetical protein
MDFEIFDLGHFWPNYGHRFHCAGFYVFKNMQCCGGYESTDVNCLSSHTFTLYANVCFEQYLDDEKEAYINILYCIDGNNDQLFL